MILRSATSVRLVMTVETATTDGAMRQARIVSRAPRKRVELNWQNVGTEVETGVRQHFNEYGQRGRTFAFQPPPTAAHPEAQYAYDEPLTVDRTNPRNVSMRCALLEAMASD